MNDYLTRMVERAAGREPAVRPIVPAVFASRPAEGPDSPVEEHRGGMEGRGAMFSSVTESAETDAAPVPRHRPVNDAAVTKPAETPRLTAPAENFQQQLPANPDCPAAVAMEREESPAASGFPAVRAAVTKNVQPAAATTESLLGAAQPDPAASTDELARKPADTDSSLFEAAFQYIRRRGARQNRELLMEGEEKPHGYEWDAEPAGGAAEQEQAVAEPVPARRAGSVTLHEREQLFTKAVEPAISAPPEPAPPTIKVSIGRVEIRAAVPQAATVESRLLSMPKVSLDEYLKTQPGRTR